MTGLHVLCYTWQRLCGGCTVITIDYVCEKNFRLYYFLCLGEVRKDGHLKRVISTF